MVRGMQLTGSRSKIASRHSLGRSVSWLVAAVEGTMLRVQHPAMSVAGLSAFLLIVPAYACETLVMQTLDEVIGQCAA